jgi:hypothetical protein
MSIFLAIFLVIVYSTDLHYLTIFPFFGKVSPSVGTAKEVAMRHSHLRLVTELVYTHQGVSPDQAIRRLTQGPLIHGGDWVFFPWEGEALRSALLGRTFTPEHLDAIVQELWALDAIEPEDDATWEDDDAHARWRVQQWRAFVEDQRARLPTPMWIDGTLARLDHALTTDRRNLVQQKSRRSLLRAALTAFMTTPDPRRLAG